MVLDAGRDLTPRQFLVLLAISERDPKILTSVKHLAEIVVLAKPPITRALDRLEELKLVTREKAVDDRREVKLLLSTGGVTFLKSVEAKMKKAAADHEKIVAKANGAAKEVPAVKARAPKDTPPPKPAAEKSPASPKPATLPKKAASSKAKPAAAGSAAV
jgi:DNA-binding MarR family transcriptional regulator